MGRLRFPWAMKAFYLTLDCKKFIHILSRGHIFWSLRQHYVFFQTIQDFGLDLDQLKFLDFLLALGLKLRVQKS